MIHFKNAEQMVLIAHAYLPQAGKKRKEMDKSG
jgi:hypothetical protein